MERRLRSLRINRKRKIAALLAAMIIFEEENENKRACRSVWTTPYLLRRDGRGMHRNLFFVLALEDPNRFRRCLRMDCDTFECLLEKATPLIKKHDTRLRKSIPSPERLSLTLRHLATGESQESLRLSFRIGQSTISNIVKEVTSAILQVLQSDFLKFPSSEEEWRNVAEDFGARWNYYNCIGAIDGKHVRIDPPLFSGSQYYNFKDFYSIVLLAVADADCRLIYVDSGANGKASDQGIWNNSSLKRGLESESLNIPAPAPLPRTGRDFPFVIVGDEGFALSKHLLVPYPKQQCSYRNDRRIFNYRLSRARRCSENTFGILGARFQIFRAPMRYDPDDANQIVLACCALHNLLRSRTLGRAMYTPSGFVDEEDIEAGEIRPGAWREQMAPGLENLARQGGNRHANDALALRDQWCEYFNSAGAVPWQEKMALGLT